MAEGVQVLWRAEPSAYRPNTVTMIEGRPASFIQRSNGVLTVRVRDDTDHDIERRLIDAELLISAIGNRPELPGFFGASDLATTMSGSVRANPNSGATNLPGVFAAGDLSRGPSLAVWAIRDGRTAAHGIHRYLRSSTTAAHDTLSGVAS